MADDGPYSPAVVDCCIHSAIKNFPQLPNMINPVLVVFNPLTNYGALTTQWHHTLKTPPHPLCLLEIDIG